MVQTHIHQYKKKYLKFNYGAQAAQSYHKFCAVTCAYVS